MSPHEAAGLPSLAVTTFGGDEPADNKSTVALVHGFTQSAASWARVGELIAEENAVVAVDLPGHGRSPAAAGDLSLAAGQLGETCGAASYVGYSLGGRICLHLALERPELVERLVLVSTTAGIEDVDERAARKQADDALAERLDEGGAEGLPAFIDEWLSGPLFEHLSEEAADRPSRLVNTAAGLAGSLRCHGTGNQMPLWERLYRLDMPVLVLAGEQDPKFVDLGNRLAAAIGPNALFVLVPGSSHALPFEQPEAFARLVSDFVAGASGPEQAEPLPGEDSPTAG